MSEVVDWLRTQGVAENETRLCILGLHPSMSDVERQLDGRYEVLSQGDGVGQTAKSDTDLVLFIARALPKSRFLLSEGSTPQARGAPSLTAGLVWAAARHADVVYLPHSEIPNARDAGAAFHTAVADCWRAGCLPVTIAPTADDRPPPGILAVTTCTKQEMRLGPLGDLLPYEYGMLRVLSDLLDAPAKAIDLRATHAVAAYVLTAIAAQPRVGLYPHLERTASLLCTSALYKSESEPGVPRVAVPFVCLSSAFDVKKQSAFRFLDLKVPYDGLVKSVEDFHKDPSKVSSDPRKRILLAVDPNSPLRLVAASSYLLDITPVFLVPSKPAILTVQLRGVSYEQQRARHLLLRTLSESSDRQQERPLFTSVERDFPLDAPEPRSH